MAYPLTHELAKLIVEWSKHPTFIEELTKDERGVFTQNLHWAQKTMNTPDYYKDSRVFEYGDFGRRVLNTIRWRWIQYNKKKQIADDKARIKIVD